MWLSELFSQRLSAGAGRVQDCGLSRARGTGALQTSRPWAVFCVRGPAKDLESSSQRSSPGSLFICNFENPKSLVWHGRQRVDGLVNQAPRPPSPDQLRCARPCLVLVPQG